MTEMTPEARRDQVVALVIAAGGVVLGTDPLAHPDDPSTVVAYALRLSAPDPTVLAALVEIQAVTEVDTAGLVPWMEPALVEDVPDPIEEEEVGDA